VWSPDQRGVHPIVCPHQLGSPQRWRQSSIGTERKGCLVGGSLKSLRRDCHINVPRGGPPIAGGLQPLLHGPPDRWSNGGPYSLTRKFFG